jgi:carbonic anhydrase/acetyltransferase-like protein (isoleucine patch superfamily)
MSGPASEVDATREDPSETEWHDFEQGDGPEPAHRHQNGGGWVANTATVASSAYVGPDAAVFQQATVKDAASIDGTAWVLGQAVVTDNARIRGDAEVSGEARVEGDALISGSSYVTDRAVVRDHAVVSGNARVDEDSVVGGNTKVRGEDEVGPAVQSQPGVKGPTPVAVARPETSGLAIASLVLGILWLGGIGSILALIFGYTGNRTIKRSQGAVGGRGLAIAGIVLGWVGTVMLLALGGLVAAAVIRGSDQLSVDGQPVTFSIHRFVDPGTDQNGNNTSGNSNDHYAIVQIAATDQGTSSLSSTLPVSAIAYGQTGAVYEATTTTPDGDDLCASGDASSLSPSETLYYCFGFVLPESDTVSRIEVSVNQQDGSGTKSWNVSDSFTGWSSG